MQHPIDAAIGATKTRSGLDVYARLDDGTYPDKIKVTDAELKAVNLHGDQFQRVTVRPPTSRGGLLRRGTAARADPGRRAP